MKNGKLIGMEYTDFEIAGVGVVSRITWRGPEGIFEIRGIDTKEEFDGVMRLLTREADAIEPISEVVAELDETTNGASDEIETAPSEVVTEEPDYTEVYARLTRLQDLVKLLRDQGINDYTSILTKACELRDTGVCPMLLKVDDLQKRLTSTCKTLQIPINA
jgi:hypothetical protein